VAVAVEQVRLVKRHRYRGQLKVEMVGLELRHLFLALRQLMLVAVAVVAKADIPQVLVEQEVAVMVVEARQADQVALPIQVAAEAAVLRLLQAVLAVLELSSFVMPTHPLPQPLRQVPQQLPLQAAIVFTLGLHQVQSHSEAQHESFCKSRKRHRHTSYCG
jgi:hypothetical protein